MTDVELYLYSGCSSCRSAQTLLNASSLKVEQRDIFREPLSAAEISALVARLGMSAEQLVAKRSRPYQSLKLAERTVSGEELVGLMANHPALLRRPIVIAGGHSQVGFRRSELAGLITDLTNGRNGHA